MNFIEDIKQQFREAIDGTLEVLRNNQELTFEAIPEYAIEVPRERNHGDFAANVSMLMAKEARMAPRKIAELIVTHLSDESLVRKVEVAEPGFINFYLDWLYKVPPVILAMKDDYGKVTKKNRTSSGRIRQRQSTGDLHMGNARGGAIGDTLANILDAAGYEVQKEFYINDAGNQIELFGASLEARYLELLGEPFSMPESGYAGQDVVDTVKEAINEFGDCLLELNTEDRRRKLTGFALERRIEYIKDTLSRFGIFYDVWFTESTLHESGEISAVMEELFNKGYIYEKEGAKWFKSTLFKTTRTRSL